MLIQGFAPICRPDARVLVLGSMPGVASLRVQQYYGHPRNAFWPIMGDIFGFDAGAPYVQRVEALLVSGVAVWDVLAACERKGSLDADIEMPSIRVNDFNGFLALHREISRICCNGALAYSMYLRHVTAGPHPAMSAELKRLPSTSPAYAGLSQAEKLVAWRPSMLCLRTEV